MIFFNLLKYNIGNVMQQIDSSLCGLFAITYNVDIVLNTKIEGLVFNVKLTTMI